MTHLFNQVRFGQTTVEPMKKMMLFLAVTTALLLSVTALAAPKADSANMPVDPALKLDYLCGTDSVTLTANLGLMRDGWPAGLENAEILFSAAGGGIDKPLGKSKTDQEGNAVLRVALGGLPAEKDGMITYSAHFAGKGKYGAADASVSAKPARIRLFFSIEDSVRILKVTATQRNEKGEEVAIPNETVPIYVPRLFSLLKIGEVSLDESGTGTLEFPSQIVGDTLGNLTILARIEEHDVFGFAQGQNKINWGVHKQYYKAEVPSRELWTPIAPMWMIITLIIMLAGVWAHYFYAVFELVMIKMMSEKDKPKF